MRMLLALGVLAGSAASAVAAASAVPAGSSSTATAAPLAAAVCLAYAPFRVSLSGTLERRTYPGRPNYESIARGDEAETGLYLVLSQPLCPQGGANSTSAEPKTDVRLVQLLLDPASAASLELQLGQTVRLTGQLMSAHTGHHHAPLLLDVQLKATKRSH